MDTTLPSLPGLPAVSPRARVQGLDTIRLFLALWVVFAHLGLFPLAISTDHAPGRMLADLYALLISGPAAVVVFFVISGFCIHYPFRDGKALALLPYFVRRHIRIWPPILAVVYAGHVLGVRFTLLQDSVLWSLVAEEIYYLIYPALLAVRRRVAWKTVLILSYIGALFVIVTHPLVGNQPGYGPYLNWLVWLPCWVLGCCLAEKSDRLRPKLANAVRTIWGWRGGAWLFSSGCLLLRFHAHIGYPWTLPFFGVYSYFWLGQEISCSRAFAPPRWLENAGKGSYSIYLVHLLGFPLYRRLALPLWESAGLLWTAKIIFTLILCFLFYLLVEKPFHALARNLAQRLAGARRRDPHR